MEARPRGIPRFSQLQEPEVARRLQRLAVLLGLTSILTAGLVGYFAYTVSRQALLDGYFEDTLVLTRTNVEVLQHSPSLTLDREALETLRRHFLDHQQAKEQW